MATHMLARLRDVPLGTIRDVLRADPHAILPKMTFLVG